MTEVLLKRSTGGVFFSTTINEGAKRVKKLMEDDYIILPIDTESPLSLKLGDYADIEGEGRFCLINPQYPTIDEDTSAYHYELKLEAQSRKWANKIFKYLPESGAEELSWKLTANIDVHTEQLKNAISSLCTKDDSYSYNGDNSISWEIAIDSSVDRKVAKYISYDNVNILDGISAIAEAFECEWWVDNNIIHFGKCEFGDSYITISRGTNATSITRNNTDEQVATRIFPFGSTENLPATYNKKLIFEVSNVYGSLDSNHPERIGIKDSSRPLTYNWFARSLWYADEDSRLVIHGKDSNGSFKEVETNNTTNGNIRTFASFSFNLPNASIGKHKLILHPLRPYVNITEVLNKGGEYAVFPYLSSILTYFITTKAGRTYKVETVLATAKNEGGLGGNNYQFGFEESAIEFEIPETVPTDIATLVEGSDSVNDESDKEIDTVYNVAIELRYECKTRLPGTVYWKIFANEDFFVWEKNPIDWNIRDVEVEFLNGNLESQTLKAKYDPSFSDKGFALVMPEGITTSDIEIGSKFVIKNIDEASVPQSYFSLDIESTQGTTINALADNRLTLAEDKLGYIDAFRYLNGNKVFFGEEGYDKASEMPLNEVIEAVVIFEEIKPEHTFTIVGDPWVKIEEIEDKDGNPSSVEKFYFYEDTFTAENQFKQKYILEGKSLSIRFSSGKLNGMEFEVAYKNELDKPTRWEIIVDDNTHLPNTIYMPEEGDTFTMTGVNVTIINDVYLDEARERLYKEASDYVASLNIDSSAYDCIMDSTIMHDGLSLSIGQRVLLHEPTFFTQDRYSRIVGFEYSLDYPYDNPKYIVGEKASYSRIGKIENKLEEIELSIQPRMDVPVQQSTQSSNSIGYIIGSNDAVTAESDSNVYSAMRVLKNFFSRTKEEVATFIWRFTKGIKIGQGLYQASINEKGIAEVEKLTSRTDIIAEKGVVTPSVSTPDFKQGSLVGVGGAMYQLNGLTYAEFDYLTARKGATFAELVIQEYNSVGGALVVSQANGEIESVTQRYDESDGLDYLDIAIKDWDKNPKFVVGDLVRCQYWDKNVNDYASYWVEVRQVLSNGIALLLGDFATLPQAGNKLVQMGHVSNPNRQGCILITTENSMPRIVVLNGINEPLIKDTNYKSIYGSLDGFTDHYTGETLSGFGLWGENIHLHGNMVLSSTNKTIEEEITSQITNDASDRNYARDTANEIRIQDISYGTNVIGWLYDVYGFTNDDTLTISFDWEAKGIDFVEQGSFISMQFNEIYGYSGFGFRLTADNVTPDIVTKGTHSKTITIKGKFDNSSNTASLPISKAEKAQLYLRFDNVQIVSGYIKISNLRINKGSISHTWQPALEDANTQLEEYKKVVADDIESLQSQIDGKVESWFFDYTPTLENYPANEWTTDELKESHIGDTFTNTQEFVDDETTPNAGKSWRWLNKDGVYDWYIIADTNATKALELASKAQDTADGKRRVFVKQPTRADAYDKGDLWVNATYGDYTNELLRCNTPKIKGNSFSIDHWERATKYTDDSALSSFINNDFAIYKADIAKQIDSKAETWYQSEDPSLNWATDEDKDNHVGDLWCYTGDTNGNYQKNETYIWDGTEWISQQVPKEVFDKIDGKAQIFVNTPTTPYYVGDLWVQGTNGDILRCKQDRLSGDYVSTDWENASKYTDDTTANNVSEELTSYKKEVSSKFEVTNGNFTSLQTEVTTKINNNANAGRNLLLGTNQGVKNWNLGTNLDKPTHYIIGEESYNDAKGVKFSKYDSANFAQWEIFFYPLRPQFITKDKEYRLSFDAKFANIDTNNTKIGIMLVDKAGSDSSRLTNYGFINITIDGQWQHYDIPLTAIKNGEIDGTQVLYIYIVNVRTTFWGSASFANLKLEEATIATPWSPAPEDAKESIEDTAKVLQSEIKQTADSISLKISESEYYTATNLIVDSYVKNENKNYLLAKYSLAAVKPKDGDTVTLSFSGKIGDYQNQLKIFNSGGYVIMTSVYQDNYNPETERYERTFQWKSQDANGVIADNSQLFIYQGINANDAVNFVEPSVIYDVMLTRTDKAVPYKSSVSDVQNKLVATGINIESKKIEVTADDFTITNNNGEVTASADQYGNWSTNALRTLNSDFSLAITANYNNDKSLKFYYPNTNVVQMEMGWDEESESLMRYYDSDGKMLWKIGSARGFAEPTFQEWVVIGLYKLNPIRWDFTPEDARENETYLFRFSEVREVHLENYYQKNVVNGEPRVYETKSDVNTVINGWFTPNSDWTETEGDMKWRTLYYYENGYFVDGMTVLWSSNNNVWIG